MAENCHHEKQPEFASIAEQALAERFPESDKPTRNGAAVPTIARFRSDEIEFKSQKEAYVWLIERFINAKPDIFETTSWQTDFVSKGKQGRYYFARSPGELFSLDSQHLAQKSSNFKLLPNGWYANTNLSSEQSLEILTRYASLANLRGEDWVWTPLERSRALKKTEDRRNRGQGLLEQMRRNIKPSARG